MFNNFKETNNTFYMFTILFFTSTASFGQSGDGKKNGLIPVKCTSKAQTTYYALGDLPCTTDTIKVSDREYLKIEFKVTNKNARNPYDYGYRELVRYKNKKAVQKIKLREVDDPPWSSMPFVRVRKQKYLADLDKDGHLEFAVFPFSPGSAIWGTVKIYSLKDKIEYWGEGNYRFEQDTHVMLGCMKCSKFDPEECKKCK